MLNQLCSVNRITVFIQQTDGHSLECSDGFEKAVALTFVYSILLEYFKPLLRNTAQKRSSFKTSLFIDIAGRYPRSSDGHTKGG